MSRRIVVCLVGGGLAALVAWAALKPAGTPADKAGAANKPQLVGVVLSQHKDVPVRLETQGTVAALNSVELRPQVASTVRELHIREGQDVAKGQRLFTLDGRNDAAKVAQASADLAQARAQLADAERNLARSRQLLQQQFVSPSAVDTAQSTVDSMRAAVAAKQAAVASAQVGLSYQAIHAPFAGRAGAIDVHPGSLVQPGAATPLLTLTQLDPIAVSFTLPEQELSRLLAAQQSGKVPALALLEKQESLPGRLSFIDSAVDAASGTIRVKAEFANPEHRLWPGAFVRIAIELGVDKNAVLLPVGSLQTGPAGQFVYLVEADETVKAQPIKLARIVTEQGKQYGIVTGLAGGQKVVAEGGQNLRPGAKVMESAGASRGKAASHGK
ncbi:efflux RND transporter periplasmic adaptor subunit [Chitinimonas arctica]|nr:efflux RND transporter periplasmic adaptor subunit [Chitinimonas arctica]